jgi:hypothetical protein
MRGFWCGKSSEGRIANGTTGCRQGLKGLCDLSLFPGRSLSSPSSWFQGYWRLGFHLTPGVLRLTTQIWFGHQAPEAPHHEPDTIACWDEASLMFIPASGTQKTAASAAAESAARLLSSVCRQGCITCQALCCGQLPHGY